MKNIITFIKKETVLTVAFLLAVISAFLITPDREYIEYIDWNTLLLLYSLMAIMAGFQQLGVFSRIGSSLLSKINSTRQMLLILIFLPFFFSMLITNDVALITFVPFGIVVLRMAKQENLVVPLVVMQTIAANLGSMLTPMGNPQNLYLYAQSGMSPLDFILLMLPYTAVAALCLFIASFFIKSEHITELLSGDAENEHFDSRLCICYVAGFLICLLCVAKLLPPIVAAVVISVFLLIKNRSILKKIDHSLLGTFIFFFIFIGNMGRIESFCRFLNGILSGHEKIVAVLSSQIISNVPASLLLSGFSDNWRALIIGTNLGGLGTLIASMASLISYKQVAAEYPERKGRYLLLFTAANVVMLGVLLLLPSSASVMVS